MSNSRVRAAYSGNKLPPITNAGLNPSRRAEGAGGQISNSQPNTRSTCRNKLPAIHQRPHALGANTLASPPGDRSPRAQPKQQLPEFQPRANTSRKSAERKTATKKNKKAATKSNKKTKKTKKTKIKRFPNAPFHGDGQRGESLLTTTLPLLATLMSMLATWSRNLTRDDGTTDKPKHDYFVRGRKFVSKSISAVAKAFTNAVFDVKRETVTTGTKIHEWLCLYALGDYDRATLARWNSQVRFRKQAAWLLKKHKTHYIVAVEQYVYCAKTNSIGQIDVLLVERAALDNHGQIKIVVVDYKGSEYFYRQIFVNNCYAVQTNGYAYCVRQALASEKIAATVSSLLLVFCGGEEREVDMLSDAHYEEICDVVQRQGHKPKTTFPVFLADDGNEGVGSSSSSSSSMDADDDQVNSATSLLRAMDGKDSRQPLFFMNGSRPGVLDCAELVRDVVAASAKPSSVLSFLMDSNRTVAQLDAAELDRGRPVNEPGVYVLEMQLTAAQRQTVLGFQGMLRLLEYRVKERYSLKLGNPQRLSDDTTTMWLGAEKLPMGDDGVQRYRCYQRKIGEGQRLFSHGVQSPVATMTNAQLLETNKKTRKTWTREDTYFLAQDGDGPWAQTLAVLRQTAPEDEQLDLSGNVHMRMLLQSPAMRDNTANRGGDLVNELVRLETAAVVLVGYDNVQNKDWGRVYGTSYGSYNSKLQRERGDTYTDAAGNKVHGGGFAVKGLKSSNYVTQGFSNTGKTKAQITKLKSDGGKRGGLKSSNYVTQGFSNTGKTKAQITKLKSDGGKRGGSSSSRALRAAGVYLHLQGKGGCGYVFNATPRERCIPHACPLGDTQPMYPNMFKCPTKSLVNFMRLRDHPLTNTEKLDGESNYVPNAKQVREDGKLTTSCVADAVTLARFQSSTGGSARKSSSLSTLVTSNKRKSSSSSSLSLSAMAAAAAASSPSVAAADAQRGDSVDDNDEDDGSSSSSSGGGGGSGGKSICEDNGSDISDISGMSDSDDTTDDEVGQLSSPAATAAAAAAVAPRKPTKRKALASASAAAPTMAASTATKQRKMSSSSSSSPSSSPSPSSSSSSSSRFGTGQNDGSDIGADEDPDDDDAAAVSDANLVRGPRSRKLVTRDGMVSSDQQYDDEDVGNDDGDDDDDDTDDDDSDDSYQVDDSDDDDDDDDDGDDDDDNDKKKRTTTLSSPSS